MGEEEASLTAMVHFGTAKWLDMTNDERMMAGKSNMNDEPQVRWEISVQCLEIGQAGRGAEIQPIVERIGG